MVIFAIGGVVIGGVVIGGAIHDEYSCHSDHSDYSDAAERARQEKMAKLTVLKQEQATVKKSMSNLFYNEISEHLKGTVYNNISPSSISSQKLTAINNAVEKKFNIDESVEIAEKTKEIQMEIDSIDRAIKELEAIRNKLN